MKKLFALAALLAVSTIPALAQDMPSYEVGAGYVYRSWGIPPVNHPPSRFSMNGFGGSFAAHVTEHFTVATDFDWTRHSETGDSIDLYTIQVGPRFYFAGHHKLAPFAEFLVGLANTRYNFSGEGSFEDSSFAWTAGGGADWKFSRHLSVRLIEADFEQTRTPNTVFPANSNDKDNNFKLKAGVVFQFGEK